MHTYYFSNILCTLLCNHTQHVLRIFTHSKITLAGSNRKKTNILRMLEFCKLSQICLNAFRFCMEDFFSWSWWPSLLSSENCWPRNFSTVQITAAWGHATVMSDASAWFRQFEVYAIQKLYYPHLCSHMWPYITLSYCVVFHCHRCACLCMRYSNSTLNMLFFIFSGSSVQWWDCGLQSERFRFVRINIILFNR